MKDFELHIGYKPGLIARVTELHVQYYFEKWNFEKYFEAKVAAELSEFILNYNDDQDRVFTLSVGGKIEASISIDGSSEKSDLAHLRCFIVSDKLRGKGAGNYLMKQAMAFCEENDFAGVYLWTFRGLDSAKHLYEKYGFRLSKELSGEQWGSIVTEQRFEAKICTP